MAQPLQGRSNPRQSFGMAKVLSPMAMLPMQLDVLPPLNDRPMNGKAGGRLDFPQEKPVRSTLSSTSASASIRRRGISFRRAALRSSEALIKPARYRRPAVTKAFIDDRLTIARGCLPAGAASIRQQQRRRPRYASQTRKGLGRLIPTISLMTPS
jgi:hypothetical protein